MDVSKLANEDITKQNFDTEFDYLTQMVNTYIPETDKEYTINTINNIRYSLDKYYNIFTQDAQVGLCTIIYPNGGSKESPGNITINTRYIEDNPFPGYHVFTEVQIFIGNQWGSTQWVFGAENSGLGVYSGQVLPDDKIIIQTGGAYLSCKLASDGGHLYSYNVEAPKIAPCRVIVYRLSKIE